MFADTAKIFVEAGRGGNGAVSFRHEKFVDKGGPDGGDGGRGGNVVFVATSSLNTLSSFRYGMEIKAESGEPGGRRNKHGKNGEDLIVKVPVGTVIKNDEKILADLGEDGKEAIVACGGRGGFGNAHFKSSVRQAPRVAELGAPGEKFDLDLELKLLADVGLVGFPNAGKSTFLSVVTSAKPEIANYPFTTLTPQLGVADIDGDSLLIADIPGLIEGAAAGKGLGDQFLRHIERTAVVLHLIDSLSEDIAKDYKTIRAELGKYSESLASKPEIIALSKIDTVDDDIIAMQSSALSTVTSAPIFAISSSAHKNLEEILRALLRIVKEVREIKAQDDSAEESKVVISLPGEELAKSFEIEQLDEVFYITGPKIEQFAMQTDFSNIHGVNRLRDILKKMGISYELLRMGATGDSLIRIGDSPEFTLLEQ